MTQQEALDKLIDIARKEAEKYALAAKMRQRQGPYCTVDIRRDAHRYNEIMEIIKVARGIRIND